MTVYKWKQNIGIGFMSQLNIGFVEYLYHWQSIIPWESRRELTFVYDDNTNRTFPYNVGLFSLWVPDDRLGPYQAEFDISENKDKL